MVMQAAMVCVLMAAIGAAALLGRNRERQWAVELNLKPHLAERLAIRLPRGWVVDQSGDGTTTPLVVTATQQIAGQPVRSIEITQFPTGVSDGASLLRAYLSQRPGVTGKVRPVHFLGQPGATAPFVWHSGDPEDPFSPILEIPEHYAAAVLSSGEAGGGKLGVVVGLVGIPGGAGRSAETVLRQIAGGLSLRRVESGSAK